MKNKSLCFLFLMPLLFTVCASVPKIEKAQYSQRHFTFSVLLTPETPVRSPQLDLAMSLLQVNYPAELANFIYEVLYQSDNPDSYKDRLIGEQREIFRSRMTVQNSASAVSVPAEPKPIEPKPDEPIPFEENTFEEFNESETGNDTDGEFSPGFNWRYSETINIMDPMPQGIVIERIVDTFSGGAHSLLKKRYYVLDLEANRQIKIDDLFQDYQGDETRSVIYEELRNYAGLRVNQPLSRGIFFSDEPELSFNFFLTQEGIGFHWNPYEIAPYNSSANGIAIIVPWQKIRPLMLHSGMELLTKFNIYLFVG